MISIELIHIASFLAAFILSYLARRLLLAWRVMDLPNSRSSHLLPVPRGGGIAVLITFFTAVLATGLDDAIDQQFSQALLYGGLGIALVGLSDDIYNLSPAVRFVTTLLIVVLCAAHLGTPSVPLIGFTLQPSAALLVCEVVAILWILHLFNFMDGIDAIASLEAISVIIIASFLMLLSSDSPTSYTQVNILLIIAFSTAGFLIWNWPPAQLFMGDLCSSFLGFVLALFAVQTSIEQTMNVWVWFILLGVFFLDATITVIRRILNREKFYQAHRQHVYQRLAFYFQSKSNKTPEAARAYAHKTVSLIVVAINFIWLAPWAYMAQQHPRLAMLFALISLVPLLLVLILAQRALPTQTAEVE